MRAMGRADTERWRMEEPPLRVAESAEAGRPAAVAQPSLELLCLGRTKS